MKIIRTNINRRSFLKGAATLPAAPLAFAGDKLAPKTNAETGGLISNAETGGLISDFVHITPDNRIVVVVKHVEAGQGPATGLATLVAEEMNADWSRVEIVFAPADNARYANLFFGIQGTGGSTAMANSFAQYRKAGATALARLVAAAAKQWNTMPQNIRAENGMLLFGENRATFGEMATAAANIPPPLAEPSLKQPAEFIHIGQENRPRKDIANKLNGTAKYSMDIHPENLLYAVVARSPKFGGVLQTFDDSAARQVRGFVGAKQIPTGVAVYGETQWAAIKARRALKTTWDFTNAETRSSVQMLADYQSALDSPGFVARQEGDANTALSTADKTATADFSFPFLAHAPMEPLNCVIQKQGDNITLWDGCQMPGLTQGQVAAIFSLPPDKVNIISTLAGGTFGRRATPNCDYQTEAAHALKTSPNSSRPLKVLWTREDDIQGGYYRPMFAHRIKAGLDGEGNISAWQQNIAGKSIMIGTPFEKFAVKEGVDNASVEGAANLPYSAANFYLDVRNMQTPISVLWWRSVGHTHTAFSTEIMMDMLAEKAGEDAIAFRLRHLQNHPRHAGVLRAVAKAAAWDKPVAAGRFRGVAVHESFNSYVAEVVEISLINDALKIEKITCAIDCGIAINPDIIRAQMEGGIGYGLGTAMRNQITFDEGGTVRETNFPSYQPLRMSDMPTIETVIIKSAHPPTGVGEPGVPPVAPALAGAIYAATGKRITHLPFTANGVKFV